MKNILVIGGSYFVGRVFVEELREHPEYAIFCLNRGNRPMKTEGVTEIVCDRHDTARLPAVIPPLEWHAVVDFCAYVPDDVATLLQSLTEAIRQYIYISTASVYQNSLTLPMNEDTPKLTGPAPVPGGDYAYKKWQTELKLKELCEKKDIAHVSLRPSFIYGKYNYAPRESYFFDLIASGEAISLPTPPQALFSMVSVWDVAQVCISCLGNERVANSAYTVAAEELVSYDRLIEVLETAASRKLEVKRYPARILNARGIPLPFPLEEHLVYSGSRLQAVLGYRYMPFAEGMTRTYHWFIETHSSSRGASCHGPD
ncbi:MAG: NAD-dependent epimerase/dehydratase family protein [Chloroflexi bacterium]|nr:NAD-dependent epimerase/dehydratase family protein [Chloroflexota bacterium]